MESLIPLPPLTKLSAEIDNKIFTTLAVYNFDGTPKVAKYNVTKSKNKFEVIPYYYKNMYNLLILDPLLNYEIIYPFHEKPDNNKLKELLITHKYDNILLFFVDNNNFETEVIQWNP